MPDVFSLLACFAFVYLLYGQVEARMKKIMDSCIRTQAETFEYSQKLCVTLWDKFMLCVHNVLDQNMRESQCQHQQFVEMDPPEEEMEEFPDEP